MAEVLVLVEHADGAPKKVTAELLTAARRLGEPSAVVIGQLTADGIAQLGQFGAAKVYVANDAAFDEFVNAPIADVLTQLVRQTSPRAVLLASTVDGKEIAGRVALRVDSGVITDAVDVAADGSTMQVIFGGAASVHASVSGAHPVITVRPNAVAAEPAPAAAEVINVTPEISPGSKRVRLVERVAQAAGGRPELGEASVIVSGGRGLGSAENFALVEALADSLGAAVGASRAATDAGWYPHSHQVGQTGKTVSPQLYVAVGISGAIQHRAGMQTAKTIVAINKDAEAPIFEIADFGVVGDLFTVVPQLTSEVSARKA